MSRVSELFQKASLRVGLLSPEADRLAAVLERCGDGWERLETLNAAHLDGFDAFVSYGHRKIIPETITARASQRILNLHISLLPWNRGADPNFWSFFNDTPKGVSIHHVDGGIDTGPVVAQRETQFSGDETLKSSYAILKREIETLFEETWPLFRVGKAPASRQSSGGSHHRKSDLVALWPRFPLGYDTTVAEVTAEGARARAAGACCR